MRGSCCSFECRYPAKAMQEDSPGAGKGSRLPVVPDHRSNIDDDDALRLEIIVERFGTVLTAEAARFNSTEGQFVVAVME